MTIHFCPLAVSALLGGAAQAQTATVTPLVDARLRWEHVEQVGLPADADAVTVRIRSGAAVQAGRWQALVEGEGTLAIVERYNRAPTTARATRSSLTHRLSS